MQVLNDPPIPIKALQKVEFNVPESKTYQLSEYFSDPKTPKPQVILKKDNN